LVLDDLKASERLSVSLVRIFSEIGDDYWQSLLADGTFVILSNKDSLTNSVTYDKVRLVKNLLNILRNFEVSPEFRSEAIKYLSGLYEGRDYESMVEGDDLEKQKEQLAHLVSQALWRQWVDDDIYLLEWLKKMEKADKLLFPEDSFWFRIRCELNEAITMLPNIYPDFIGGEEDQELAIMLIANEVGESGSSMTFSHLCDVMKGWSNLEAQKMMVDAIENSNPSMRIVLCVHLNLPSIS